MYLGFLMMLSQSTIKMDKGYYKSLTIVMPAVNIKSQSTIKMEKGYYLL